MSDGLFPVLYPSGKEPNKTFWKGEVNSETLERCLDEPSVYHIQSGASREQHRASCWCKGQHLARVVALW